MTYRRLFLLISVLSTSTFVVLWIGSLRSVWTFGYSSSPETVLTVQLDLGTIRMTLTDLATGTKGFRASRVPIQPYEFQTLREIYGHPGKFRLRRYPVNPTTTVRKHNYVLWIPMWLPFLLAAGTAYGLMRVMEPKSTGKREKALAESAAKAIEGSRLKEGTHGDREV